MYGYLWGLPGTSMTVERAVVDFTDRQRRLVIVSTAETTSAVPGRRAVSLSRIARAQ
jgi:hypothetical protein